MSNESENGERRRKYENNEKLMAKMASCKRINERK